MNKKLIFSLLGVIIVAVVLTLLFMPQQATTPGTQDGTDTSRIQPDGADSTTNSSADTSDAAEAVAQTINIEDFDYSVKTVNVKVGETVKWVNKDSVAHTVTADEPSDNAPDSGSLDQNESYSFTFTKAGTYDYFCEPHPDMRATVIVTD